MRHDTASYHKVWHALTCPGGKMDMPFVGIMSRRRGRGLPTCRMFPCWAATPTLVRPASMVLHKKSRNGEFEVASGQMSVLGAVGRPGQRKLQPRRRLTCCSCAATALPASRSEAPPPRARPPVPLRAAGSAAAPRPGWTPGSSCRPGSRSQSGYTRPPFLPCSPLGDSCRV